MRKAFVLLTALALVFMGYMAYTSVDSGSAVPIATAAGAAYSGKIYVAGMGGHFSDVELEIDPSNAAEPFAVKKLDRIVIGDKNTHPTHDPRIDSKDANVLLWSTYKADLSKGERMVHVGKSDLKTGKVIMDKTLEIAKEGEWIGAVYCGSGQTNDYFIPVTMTDLAYIDVFNKKTMELKSRVFLPGYKKGDTKFYHGTNTPDMKYFVVAVNLATGGKLNGNIDILKLDMKDLINGKATIVSKNKVTGTPGKTITFRQSFTPDGKYLLQSAGDRFLVLDGKTLDLVDEEIMSLGENHDALSTLDGKYGILTIRAKIATGAAPDSPSVTDGQILLYDVSAASVVGKPTSVCYACHKDMGLSGNMVLCGLDGRI